MTFSYHVVVNWFWENILDPKLVQLTNNPQNLICFNCHRRRLKKSWQQQSRWDTEGTQQDLSSWTRGRPTVWNSSWTHPHVSLDVGSDINIMMTCTHKMRNSWTVGRGAVSLLFHVRDFLISTLHHLLVTKVQFHTEKQWIWKPWTSSQ